MKIINVKTNLIYTVVDTRPNQDNMEIHVNLAKTLLKNNHQDDGGNWAEVEEVKEVKEKPAPKKRTRRKKADPK